MATLFSIVIGTMFVATWALVAYEIHRYLTEEE